MFTFLRFKTSLNRRRSYQKQSKSQLLNHYINSCNFFNVSSDPYQNNDWSSDIIDVIRCNSHVKSPGNPDIRLDRSKTKTEGKVSSTPVSFHLADSSQTHTRNAASTDRTTIEDLSTCTQSSSRKATDGVVSHNGPYVIYPYDLANQRMIVYYYFT